MITLIQFPRSKTVPNFSPFCLKLETWLRMAGLDYECQYVMNPGKSPKGKLPIIKIDDKVYCDSELIIATLSKQYDVKLDNHLSKKEKAYCHAIDVLCAERLSWLMTYFRWQDNNGWQKTKSLFFAGIPASVKHVIAYIVRRNMIKAFYAQGMGRHNIEEVRLFAQQCLQSLAAILNEQSFFGGSSPASVDASVFGLLGLIIFSGLDDELYQIAQTHPNLVAYSQRMMDAYYPEYKPVCSAN